MSLFLSHSMSSLRLPRGFIPSLLPSSPPMQFHSFLLPLVGLYCSHSFLIVRLVQLPQKTMQRIAVASHCFSARHPISFRRASFDPPPNSMPLTVKSKAV